MVEKTATAQDLTLIKHIPIYMNWRDCCITPSRVENMDTIYVNEAGFKHANMLKKVNHRWSLTGDIYIIMPKDFDDQKAGTVAMVRKNFDTMNIGKLYTANNVYTHYVISD